MQSYNVVITQLPLGIGKLSTKDIGTRPPNQAWKRFAPRFHLAPPAFNVFCAEASAHAPSRRAMFPNRKLQKLELGRPRHIDSCGRMIKDPILRISTWRRGGHLGKALQPKTKVPPSLRDPSGQYGTALPGSVQANNTPLSKNCVDKTGNKKRIMGKRQAWGFVTHNPSPSCPLPSPCNPSSKSLLYSILSASQWFPHPGQTKSSLAMDTRITRHLLHRHQPLATEARDR